MDKYRVVFHLDEGNRGRSEIVLHNIENLLADLGQGNVEVELVANGRGVVALLNTADGHAEQVAALAARGVRFVACANSLRQLGISRSALLDPVGIVPAGVGELVRKQAEGWAYIRP